MGLGEISLGEMGLGEMGLGEMGQNPSRYALCLWDPPNPRSELCTHLAAEHPRQHNRRDLCPEFNWRFILVR